MDTMQTLDRGDGVKLAYAHLPGRGPTVVFLPGYKSDMEGTKAVDLAEFCAARGQACLRLDYSGHGASGGDFMDGTIGTWLADALAIINHATTGPVILIGSSMGGWIALLAALALKDRVAGLIGIAAAPDFSESLVWEQLSFAERTEVMDRGFIMRPNPYGDAYPFTRALIEDGRTRLLLDNPIPLTCPIRMLHGQADNEVPWELSLRVAEQAASPNVRVILVKDGDHRLSRPEDLALLRETLAGL